MNEPSRLWGAIPSGLPGNVIAHGRTPDFALESLPEALKVRAYDQAKRVGIAHVLEGRLLYALEPPHTGQMVLVAGETAPIPPRTPHRLAFTECGRFFVEFYKEPGSASDGAPNREPNGDAPGLAASIDEALIRTVVESFYARVRADEDLISFFKVIGDWPVHLARMCNFWWSITLITGAYKGDVIGAHVSLPGLGDSHFARWIQLFGATRALHA